MHNDFLKLIACWVAFAAALLGSGVVNGLLHSPIVVSRYNAEVAG
jgi:hypothetical protein